MENIFKIIKDGKEEIVSLERWVWVAIYKDGTYLKQFDEGTGLFHQFKEIDQNKLDVFVMQSVQEQTKRYEIHFKEGMSLIHYYRHTVLEFGTPQEQRIKVYCFGYKENIEGKSRKTILQIYPNDVVAIVSDDGR
jgi:hypothetical protein